MERMASWYSATNDTWPRQAARVRLFAGILMGTSANPQDYRVLIPSADSVNEYRVPRSTSLRRHRPMGRPFGQALLVWSSGVTPQSVTYG